MPILARAFIEGGVEVKSSKKNFFFTYSSTASPEALNNSAVVASEQRIRGARWLPAHHSGAARLLLKVNMPPAASLITGPLRSRLPGGILKAPAAGPQLAEFLRSNIHFRKGEHLRTVQASAAGKRTAGSSAAANAERRIRCRSLAVMEHVRRRKLDMSAVITAGRRGRGRQEVAPNTVGRRRRCLMVPGMQKRLPRRQICRTVCKVAGGPTADAA